MVAREGGFVLSLQVSLWRLKNSCRRSQVCCLSILKAPCWVLVAGFRIGLAEVWCWFCFPVAGLLSNRELQNVTKAPFSANASAWRQRATTARASRFSSPFPHHYRGESACQCTILYLLAAASMSPWLVESIAVMAV